MPPKKIIGEIPNTIFKSVTIDGEYTNDMGCESSYADAKHDFHDVFTGPEGQSKIKNYVSQNIPSTTCTDNLTEDKFLMKYILKTSSSPSSSPSSSTKPVIIEKMQQLFKGSTDDSIDDIFNSNITQRYTIIPINRPQHDNELKLSKIQKELQQHGVFDDIFLICDVAYANVREDLTFVDKKKDQTFFWVQNAQTLYDPAGKTAWHTGKDYGFQLPDSRFLFCWENANRKAITYYPNWDGDNISYGDDKHFYPEKMLYTNKDLYLTIKNEKKEDNYDNYKNHDAILIITDQKKPGFFAYSDKDL